MTDKFLSIAPMVDISNTHFRSFIRLVTVCAPVYTEMLHHDAILNNSVSLLPFSPQQHPIIVQLGGCDPESLAKAAVIAQSLHYDGINLNVDCPSPRVQKGMFGACLMKVPNLVRDCVKAVRQSVKIPCTIKCRLGVDQYDSYEFVRDFVLVNKDYVNHFVIHARKALLGINPLQNRNIPPLMYERVYRLKKEFPQIVFEINGGIKSVREGYRIVVENGLDGCMVGRMAYQNSFQLRHVDSIFYGVKNKFYDKENMSIDQLKKQQNEHRLEILLRYADYLQRLVKKEVYSESKHLILPTNPATLFKPVLNLYHGQRNCAKFRQMLSEQSRVKEKLVYQVVREAAKMMYEFNIGGGIKTDVAKLTQDQKTELQQLQQEQIQQKQIKKQIKQSQKQKVEIQQTTHQKQNCLQFRQQKKFIINIREQNQNTKQYTIEKLIKIQQVLNQKVLQEKNEFLKQQQQNIH